MTATQRAVVDDLGNINVHGRSALELVWKVKDADGNLVNISASDLFFEIDTKLRIELTAGEDNYSRKLTLSRAQIATLPLNQPLQYALHDETPSSPATIWNGRVTAYGFRTAPSGAAAVDPGVASWTGATVIVQQGESVPTVVVTYMGATGYGMPSGGTVGQYIRKSSSTPYDVAWDTVTGSDVGLGNVDNTSDANKPVSTAQQAALDLKLNLAGGTLSGVLAFIAGTAALPGLAVAGDLNTGIYGVSADVLGVSAGGLNAASFSNGQLSLATAAGGAGVNLAVDGANALALRSGANAQAFRVYNTYTDVSNYEMGHIAWQSNEFRIGTLRAGTGTGRDLVFQTNGSSRWYIASSGNLLASADNTYDIGASGANRPRNLYLGTSLVTGSGATIQGLTVGLGANAVAGNTAVGVSALSSGSVSGTGNTAIGYRAGYILTTGLNATLIGNAAGLSMTTANDTTAVGTTALQSLTTGNSNVAVASYALQSLTTGSANTAVGVSALVYNRTGSNNTALGYHAFRYASTGSNSVAVGYRAAQNTTTQVATLGAITPGSGYTNGTYNGVQLTYSSGSTMTTYPTADITVAGGVVTVCTLVNGGVGAIDTTTVLSVAAASVGGTGAGFTIPVATLTAAPVVTAVGYQALNANTTGINNTAVGSNALTANTTGAGNNAFGLSSLSTCTTGNDNAGFGLSSLAAVTTGSSNVGVGNYAALATNTGSSNVAIGASSLVANTTGSGNVAVGRKADEARTAGDRNIVIGFDIDADSTTGSDQINIGAKYFHNRIITTPLTRTEILALTGIVEGMRAFCTDSDTSTFYSTFAGGGSINVPVFYDGAAWRVG